MNASDSAEEPTIDADVSMVASHVARLCEHFESVQIFATKRTEGSKTTRNISRGGGNYYASAGAVREWVVRQDESSRMFERGGE